MRQYYRRAILFSGIMGYLISVSVVHALSLSNITIRELFETSEEVVHVEIFEGSIACDSDDCGRCGNDYQAKVITRFKGDDSKVVKFRTNGRLIIGEEYLIFLNKEFFDAKVKYLYMGRKDYESYEKCLQSETTLYASSFYGEIFEFDYLLEALEDVTWLKNKTTHIQFPENFTKRTLTFKSDDVSIDYLEFISSKLINWEELKSYLTELGDENRVMQ